MPGMFEGRVALVTGGSSGIGRGTAVAFAREGARVVIAARRRAESEETARLVRQAGGEAVVAIADVAVASQVEAMVGKAVEAFGRLDFAVNNAGVGGGGGPIHEVREQDWDRVIDTNLKGVWLSMKYELARMLGQGRGCIVNVSSSAGLIGWAPQATYTTSKWGVIGLTKSAALQYAGRGIRINAVCPGYIRTDMNAPRLSDPRVEEAMRSAIPLGRIGVVDDVAAAIIWLCSDAASFVVGHALTTDGGEVAGDVQ